MKDSIKSDSCFLASVYCNSGLAATISISSSKFGFDYGPNVCLRGSVICAGWKSGSSNTSTLSWMMLDFCESAMASVLGLWLLFSDFEISSVSFFLPLPIS